MAIGREGTPAAPAGEAVGRGGTFRPGSAAGRGPDRPAAVLGAPARERHRRLRLAEFHRLFAAVGERLDGHRADDLDRRGPARSKLDAAPDETPAQEAARPADRAARRLDDARIRVEDLRQALRPAEDEGPHHPALPRLPSAQHGLPAETDALDALEAWTSAAERW